MGLEFSGVRLGTSGDGAVFAFWGEAFGVPPGLSVVGPDVGGMGQRQVRGPFVALIPTSESTVAAECARLVACGATILGKYHNGWGCGWVELADPDGNLFIVESREPEDFEALLATPRETADPFWSDAVDRR
ncbi:VOC family protein [Streptacidiphilus sp. MAP5-3]|uniref:VOC family protein n=1 Tax=unclassified Streptacidiphilus TaxID=2643834 RepID=UPI003516F722